MKRKLSLLIAMVMVLSLIPAMSVSAATRNTMHIGGGSVAKDFKWSEHQDATPFLQVRDDTSGITYKSGDTFRVDLSNAEWELDEIEGVGTKNYKYDSGATINGLELDVTDAGPILQDVSSARLNAPQAGASTEYSIDFINKKTAQVTIKSYDPSVFDERGQYMDRGILIPLMVKMKGAGPATATITAQSARVTSGVVTFAVGADGKVTYTCDDESRTFAKTLEVAALELTETVPGTLKMDEDGTVKFTAPSGFEWLPPSNEQVQAYGGFGLTGKVNADLRYQTTSSGKEDKQVLIFDFDTLGIGRSVNSVGTLQFTGLQLTRTGSVSETPTGDVKVKIDATNGGSGYVTVGDFNRRAVAISTEDKALPEIVNGTYPEDWDDEAIQTLLVTIKESADNAFNTRLDTVLTLTDGVKFRGVEVDSIDNNNGALSEGDQVFLTHLGNNVEEQTDDGGMLLKDTKLTFRGGNYGQNAAFIHDGDELIEVTLKVFVSVKPGFTGDIQIFPHEDNEAFTSDAKVSIAKAINPFTITATNTDVELGYMNVAVGEFTIKETVPGALKRQDKLNYTGNRPDLEMWIGGYSGFGGTDDLGFKSPGTYEVVSGDIVIEDYGLSGNHAFLAVKRESSVASEIKFSGFTIDTNRSIPEGKLDLRIGGSAVANYYDRDSKDYGGHNVRYFSVPGYVNIITAAPNKDQKYTTVVSVKVGGNVVTANGKEYQMDVAPYNDNGYVMVPTRAVAVALGVNDDAIKWDAVSKTVTILDTNRNRTSQFQVGSNIIKQNGADIRFDGPSCAVVNSRTFLPFRALGEVVLGCPVSWDQAAQTAWFNQYNQ